MFKTAKLRNITVMKDKTDEKYRKIENVEMKCTAQLAEQLINFIITTPAIDQLIIWRWYIPSHTFWNSLIF